MERKHEKYERLIARCKSLPPTPTAVAHPCDESSLRAAVDAAKAGLIAPILVGPRARIEARGQAARHRYLELRDRGCAAQRSLGRRGGGAGARGQGGSADERQPPHRRADGRGGQARHRPAHGAAHQPLLRHGRARAPGAADHHRRRRQHRADAQGQGAYRAERDRPRARSGRGRGAGGDPLGDGDGQSRRALHARGGRAVQDGRPQADHGRHARRPARARQRDQPRGGEDQEDRFAGRRARQRAGRAGSRSRQHARQEPVVPRRRRRRRHRARRARADHPHQPRRFGDGAPGFVRGGRAGRERAPRQMPAKAVA